MKAIWTQPHPNKSAHVWRTPLGDMRVWECGTASSIDNELGDREYGDPVRVDFTGTLEQCKQWCEDWLFPKLREMIGVEAYTIKPLEWVIQKYDPRYQEACTTVGRFQVLNASPGVAIAYDYTETDRDGDPLDSKSFPTLEEAKAQCEVWYNTMLTGSLNPL